ncbi:MAG: hypothetical protein L0332_13600, partial [Chloroflexi bacterium]|nr:hypothetical protein [Chloroflexota bacterium]MCI0649977.1 hypothetical protein [Chloroflexota bacterium]MCI0727739.1 hypothetical protein [Chloroflexota bacterium]
MKDELILNDAFGPAATWPAENGRPPRLETAEAVQMKALEVGYDRKFNLGNFESLQAAITIWVRLRLPEGQPCDLHDVRQRLRSMARENVKGQLYRVQGKHDIPFLGLMPPANGREPITV